MNFTGKTVINDMKHLKKILKQFFSVANDNLETLIISNIGWFAFCSPFILVQFYFIRKAKKTLQLKKADYDKVGIDYTTRDTIWVWVYKGDKISVSCVFNCDGSLRWKN